MRIHYAALVAAALAAPPVAPAATLLTLQEAFRRTTETHPQLARFAQVQAAADAELQRAGLGPRMSLGLELENAFGSGGFQGLDQSELTLNLASVLETGGKREARTSVAQARADAVELERDAARLDILAEVARRFLDVLHAQSSVEIERLDVEQRQRSVEAATRSLQAGAAPESVKLSAEAARARAQLNLARAQAGLETAMRRLCILWRDKAPEFAGVAGNPLALPDIAPLARLQAELDANPELRQFASEQRVREARLQLARSERSVDLEWQFGVRRIEETGDWAAVAGVSMPLGTRGRAESAVRVAQAELSSLSFEREIRELALHTTLTEAHAAFTAERAAVIAARDDLLPRLARATAAAERAYRAGAASYLEWAEVQAAAIDTRRVQLDASMQAHRALIEIQRLTGQPFLVEAADNTAEIQP